MQDELLLIMLKQNLEIMHSMNEDLLLHYINFAKAMIAQKGIRLGDEYEDHGLVAEYAAYLYRSRARPTGTMPEYLRSAINDKLCSQKARVVTDV